MCTFIIVKSCFWLAYIKSLSLYSPYISTTLPYIFYNYPYIYFSYLTIRSEQLFDIYLLKTFLEDKEENYLSQQNWVYKDIFHTAFYIGCCFIYNFHFITQITLNKISWIFLNKLVTTLKFIIIKEKEVWQEFFFNCIFFYCMLINEKFKIFVFWKTYVVSHFCNIWLQSSLDKKSFHKYSQG